jgi:hypothetical protein
MSSFPPRTVTNWVRRRSVARVILRTARKRAWRPRVGRPPPACRDVRRDLPRSSEHHALRPFDRECLLCPLTDKAPFPLREASQHIRHKLAVRRGGIQPEVKRHNSPSLLTAQRMPPDAPGCPSKPARSVFLPYDSKQRRERDNLFLDWLEEFGGHLGYYAPELACRDLKWDRGTALAAKRDCVNRGVLDVWDGAPRGEGRGNGPHLYRFAIQANQAAGQRKCAALPAR